MLSANSSPEEQSEFLDLLMEAQPRLLKGQIAFITRKRKNGLGLSLIWGDLGSLRIVLNENGFHWRSDYRCWEKLSNQDEGGIFDTARSTWEQRYEFWTWMHDEFVFLDKAHRIAAKGFHEILMEAKLRDFSDRRGLKHTTSGWGSDTYLDSAQRQLFMNGTQIPEDAVKHIQEIAEQLREFDAQGIPYPAFVDDAE